MKTTMTFEQMFPRGEKLPAQFSRYFTGQAYLAPLTHDERLGVPAANVTFEPGCRNNWHSHTGGQLLICTAGRGYYQERGCPARELKPGDVVEIAPDAVHWHGAAPDSWFSHLAIECDARNNRNTWLDPVDDAQYAEATAGSQPDLGCGPESRWPAAAEQIGRTDPELAGVFDRFVFGEVLQYGELDMKSRLLVTLASVVAQQAESQYGALLRAAIANGIAPEEIREVLYHAVPYVGMAKVLGFIERTDGFFAAQGIALPLGARAATTPDTRYAEGLALQKSIFGEEIGRMAETMPENQRHIAHYLSANCFGDYQIRAVFDARQRELLTFAMLVSLGGCESQVKSHIRGNLRMGSDKQTLLTVVTQLLPYIGYPRALNAIACLNEAVPEE